MRILRFAQNDTLNSEPGRQGAVPTNLLNHTLNIGGNYNE